ncbi:hypothetical protein H6S82_16455 [Planktothrix sp. FACHB-1355]|uniref:Uncharacterized protein n=1 Tax=Aerosakkonema funiforme FACHB-1375 TaxID=2949571 RepID=A0A926ZKF1_9CYAN|nr:MULTISPECIES: hypothetical protein [Oscillatoriales]MBD2185885.1 hypothetical protein [Aerosakkonema funiforme FACHB-1375]MBD3560432.1 hypothetical protein [Planktothrix sp. FACHB-1355]
MKIHVSNGRCGIEKNNNLAEWGEWESGRMGEWEKIHNFFLFSSSPSPFYLAPTLLIFDGTVSIVIREFLPL